MLKIQPLHDRVLVKVITETEKKTPSGLYLKVSEEKQLNLVGEVIEVGPGRMTETGLMVQPEVSIGQMILFGAMTGANIDEPVGFEDHVLLRWGDILAVLETVEEEVAN